VISPFVHRVQPHVEQKFIRVSKAQRAEKLLELVKSEASDENPMIIFSSQATTSDWLAMFLNENGVKTANYNAAMMKNIREHQFGLFRSGAVSVMSSTDLGSRGLDTTNVRHIVNFDFPRSLSDYIHR
jgi:superfamily II DNA/RNA helicase